MADLHVLCRSDSNLLHIACSDDVARCAARLDADQAFDVKIAALLPGLGCHLPAVQRHLRAPVKGHWYAVALPAALQAMAAGVPHIAACGAEAAETCRDGETLSHSDSGTGAVSVGSSIRAEVDEEWRQFLEPCTIAEADRAVVVLRALREKLGKPVTKQVLRNARQVALKGSDGVKRRVWKVGHVRGQALRLRR